MCPRADGAMHALSRSAASSSSSSSSSSSLSAGSPFVHAVCVNLVPALHYVDLTTAQPPAAPLNARACATATGIGCVAGTALIPKGLQKLVCVLCGERNGSTCVQCRVNSCAVAFHAQCARAAGWDVAMHESNAGAFCH